MKKIIITMVAIAFSLSAYSAMTILEENRLVGMTFCVSGFTFFRASSGVVQIMNEEGLPMKCSEYKK